MELGVGSLKADAKSPRRGFRVDKERSFKTLKILRPTSRALLLLVCGIVVTVLFYKNIDALWGGIFWGVLIGVVYFPLAHIKCPKCKKFPFKYIVNIGGLPFLCFWPDQKCDHCGSKVVI